MKARGIVPVGAPVDKNGRATADLSAMVGIAARDDGLRHHYDDGEPFELVTDKQCLIHLVAACDVTIRGEAVRLFPGNANYVHIRAGRIVHVEQFNG